LTIRPGAIRKININEAGFESLSKNPYIAPTLAKQFIGYRTKVKPFDEVEEIRKLYYLRDHPELYEKISPYITVN
jgi:DNA uptake protein ComE-like DNA-binding protein